MRTSQHRYWLRPRVIFLALIATLLLTGLRGTPAGAICSPGRGRTGPLPPPPDEKPGPLPQPPPPGDRPGTPKPGGDPTPVPTPPPVPGPTTPPGAGGTTPTTGGGVRRARRSAGAESIEWKWSTWWIFNRWNYLPRRNEVVRRAFERFRVVTGGSDGTVGGWESRRDELAKTRAAPALVRLMRADLRPGDVGIKAAASLALARVANTPEAVTVVMAALEDPTMTHEVRESAAFAAGLFRRSEPERQMEGSRVDALRARLFALANDGEAPRKVRCLALMSVGMLGDQPRGTPLPDGVMETRSLWRGLVASDQGSELHIAYLTALGMQPQSGAGDVILDGLRDIAIGKRFAKRSWSSRERSHALCTLVRLGGARRSAALSRLITDRRITTDVRRAAFITLAERSSAYGAEERQGLVRTWQMALKNARDPLTRGLGLIALGRILAADLEAAEGSEPGARGLLRTTEAGAVLLKYARTSAQNMRGFAVLALALAIRAADGASPATLKFRAAGQALLREGLAKNEGNAAARGPYVVAVGLAGLADVLPVLESIVVDANAEPQLRAYAAVACGQIGDAGQRTVYALKRAVADYKLGNLRLEAALGLAFLTGDRDARLLRQDIERRRYTHSHRIGHVAIALGQMGDLRAIVPLAQLLLDAKSDHGARGAAAVALGVLCDPESTPSQSRLWQDANYPARSAALHTALNFY